MFQNMKKSISAQCAMSGLILRLIPIQSVFDTNVDTLLFSFDKGLSINDITFVGDRG